MEIVKVGGIWWSSSSRIDADAAENSAIVFGDAVARLFFGLLCYSRQGRSMTKGGDEVNKVERLAVC